MKGTPAPGRDEDGGELQLLSFVIRLWIEEPAAGRHAARWRGQITHVTSGTRRYVERLADIVIFIAGYLEGAGARTPRLWRTACWLRGRRR